MSLKQTIHDIIRAKGYVSIQEVHSIAEDMGHKQSNVERRLRESESPQIQAVKNEKGFIQGYHWVGETVFDSDLEKRYPKLFEKQTERTEDKQQTLL